MSAAALDISAAPSGAAQGIQALLASYPREGAPLSAAQAAIYAEEYKRNREGADAASGAAQKLEEWMHRQVSNGTGRSPVLEVGAGTLNHLRFEADDVEYDIVEPFTLLFDGQDMSRIRDVYASQFDIADRRYARIVSVAVLEHISRLPEEVALSASLLEEDGVFQAGIPSEGGLLWWAGWRFTTGLSYWLRHKMDYGNIMRHEHLSKASEIISVVRHFFEDVKVKRWPLPFKHASFYQYIEARRPRQDVVKAWLSAQPGAIKGTV